MLPWKGSGTGLGLETMNKSQTGGEESDHSNFLVRNLIFIYIFANIQMTVLDN